MTTTVQVSHIPNLLSLNKSKVPLSLIKHEVTQMHLFVCLFGTNYAQIPRGLLFNHSLSDSLQDMLKLFVQLLSLC